MKTTTLCLLTCLTFLSFISCTKDEDNTPPTYPVYGLWTGTYLVDGLSQPPLFYSFVIYEDGSIITKSKIPGNIDIYTSGTWTLTAGKDFKAIINTFVKSPQGESIVQELIAQFSNDGKMTNGAWKDTYSPTASPLNKGTFSVMQRVN